MVAFERTLGEPLLFGASALAARLVGRGEVWSAFNRSVLLAPDSALRVSTTRCATVAIPLERGAPTFYTRHGDLSAEAAVLIAVLMLWYAHAYDSRNS